ncbi:F-box associated interaction domain-containing protein [Artemisia annua]|uniref:F-box associated interaction domain-containing protein n=1 Tax=Artemisia annua TaxID=35608 RepID=A0A2U1MR74_ARTAN|nr:F-box associated interaction domain-containing protein [Artemisia annua]
MEHRRRPKREIVITEEIVFEILLRVPVRSLLICKSVCKFLISDQHFIKSHVKLSTIKSHTDKSPLTRNKLIIRVNEPITRNYLYPMSSFPLLETYGDHRIEIVGSCNGLLCIIERGVTLIIYNPSTKELNTLPRPTDLIIQEGFVQKYAFGYDESTDDYKVVALSFLRRTLFSLNDNSQKLVKIYSLKTGKWKSINDFHDVLTTPNNGLFLNGALHWVGSKDRSVRSSRTIVSLDLAKETYGEISQPMYEEGHPGSVTLGLMGEWLCVMCGYLKKRVDV